MIFSSISLSPRYTALHPLFPRVFDYIRNTNLRSLTPGRYDIAGDDLFAIVEHVPGRTRAEAKLECHRRYIDIQLILEGTDEMGWKALADCHSPENDYNTEQDIQFFDDTPTTWVATPPHHFCIFFPEDTHAPLIAKGEVRKIIFKVRVE